ncbi:MAG: hypothetical protein ABIA12_00195 [Candidatus Aenigmatarchaeota archaeon]
MQFLYSGLIANFMDVLGTPKHVIDETFNKPDSSDVLTDWGVSIKNFGDYFILIVFHLDGQDVRFMSAYRVYQQLLSGVDLHKSKPLEVLKAFMEKYGIEKEFPGHGTCKFLVERGSNVFFPGILDIDKYLADVEKLAK